MYKYGIIETENRTGKAGKDNVLTWLFEENGTLSIFGAGMLPDYKEEQERPWQEYADQVTSVVIDDGITSIGARTFSGYEKLESVKLPQSMNRIGFRAFADCPRLTKVITDKPVAHVYSTNVASASRGMLKSDTIYIGMKSFDKTPWITETFGAWYIHRDVLVEYYGQESVVEIPRGIREIGVSAFEQTPVTQVKFPDTLRVIGSFAFNQTGLRAVELPASLRKVDRYAFAQTEQLQSVLMGNPDLVLEEKAFWNSAVETEMNPEKGVFESVYHLETLREPGYEPCKKLEIRRDKKKVIGLTTLPCGKAIAKKMTSAGPVFQICANPETKVVNFVQSFVKDGRDQYACYMVKPVLVDGVITAGQEQTSQLAKWELEAMSCIGLWPEEASSGRSWYQAPKGTPTGVNAELDLLSCWLKKNSGFTVAEK